MIFEQIIELIDNNPEATAGYLIIGKVVGAILMLPGTPLTLLAGASLGLFWGSIVSIIGNFIGASLAFLISRYFLHKLVQRRFVSKYPAIMDYERKFARHGLTTVILLRLIPLFPFNVLNYLLGVTSIRTKDYLVGTLVGIIPGTIVFVYFGEAVMMLSVFHIITSILAIIGLVYIGKSFQKKYEQ